MKIEINITNEQINDLISKLNELEYEGRLTRELFDTNPKIQKYLTRKCVITALLGECGDEIDDLWNGDGFHKLGDMLDEINA